MNRLTLRFPEALQQSTAFAELLESLGQSSAGEIEKVLLEREIVEPEADLDSDFIKRLQDRCGWTLALTNGNT